MNYEELEEIVGKEFLEGLLADAKAKIDKLFYWIPSEEQEKNRFYGLHKLILGENKYDE